MNQRLTKGMVGMLLSLALFTGCGLGQPQLSQEELAELWRPIIGISALTYGTCEATRETAAGIAGGETDGMEGFGALLGAGMMLGIVDEGLPNWQAEETGTERLKEELTAETDELRSILGRWQNDQIDSREAAAALEDLCAEMNGTFEDLVGAAERMGLDSATAEEILREMESAFSEMGGSFEQ